MTETKESVRGKRKAATRFEALAALTAMGVITAVLRCELDASQISAMTGFGATVFLACLGYSAALRGIDSYAHEVLKKSD